VNSVDELPSAPNNTYTYDSLHGDLDTRNTYTTLEYDNYNTLSKINWPGSVNTQFVSDAQGNRVGLTTSGGAEYEFLYDVTAGAPVVLIEQEGTYDPAGNMTKKEYGHASVTTKTVNYVYDANNRLVDSYGQ